MIRDFPVSMQGSISALDKLKAQSFREYAVIWPLVASLAILFSVNALSGWLSSGVRASVSSENRWSQARHMAGSSLRAYIDYGRPADHAQFLEYLKIPKALRRARSAALDLPVDEPAAKAALLEGGVHADDVLATYWLLRLSPHETGARRAIEIWREGDAALDDLLNLGTRAQQLHAVAHPVADAQAAMAAQLDDLNRRLDLLEKEHGTQVSSTARKYAAVLLYVQILMTAGLMIAGIYTTRRFARRRIQIEASAQRARERLELATLNSNDGIWDWHIQSKQVFWTPRIPQLLGYEDSDQFRSYSIRDNVHPDDIDKAMMRLREHLGGLTEQLDLNVRFKCRDGNYRWYRARAMAIRNAANHPMRVLGTLSDVHAHTMAEQSLKSAWTHARQVAGELELALEGADVALWAYEPATGAIIHHKRWESLLGRPVMPPTFAGWLELTHVNDRQMRVALLEAHLNGDTTYYESEFRMLHANGDWVWVRSRGRVTARDASGRALQYAGAVMNINAQVAARELQQREKDFLQAMIQGVDLGVMISDYDRVVYANRSLAALLDYEHEDDLRHEALVKLMSASERAVDIGQRAKAAAGGILPVRVVRLKTRHQRRVKVVMNLSCVDWNGSPHFISTVSPLTEHADLEVHLRAAEERYERAMMSELEAQQASIARELHDSLGSILAGISLLLRSATSVKTNDGRNALLNRTQEQVQAAAEMTRAMARGIMPVGSHAGAFVQALEQFTHDLDDIKGVRADFVATGNFDHVPPEIGNHVYRIVQEATTNAIRHEHASSIQLSLMENGKYMQLAIQDNGRGWAENHQKAGTEGIGIRSMRARTRAIRGHLEFEGTPNSGLRLQLTWPMRSHTALAQDETQDESTTL